MTYTNISADISVDISADSQYNIYPSTNSADHVGNVVNSRKRSNAECRGYLPDKDRRRVLACYNCFNEVDSSITPLTRPRLPCDIPAYSSLLGNFRDYINQVIMPQYRSKLERMYERLCIDHNCGDFLIYDNPTTRLYYIVKAKHQETSTGDVLETECDIVRVFTYRELYDDLYS